MYTTQKILLLPGERTLVLKANGGTLAVEKQVGPNWVAADTFSADGVFVLELGRTQTRFTPTGGAVYEVTN